MTEYKKNDPNNTTDETAEDNTVFISDSKSEPSITSREAFIVVIKGGSVDGKKYRLTSCSMIVGRNPDSDICVDQKSISRKHAEILLDPSCLKATINDLSSMNGTFYKGKRIKSVEIFDGEQIEFGDVTCKFVTSINAETNLIEFASIDDMTKTYNKRYFNEIINSEFKKSKQTGTTISLIMYDIDRFKKINDVHGHSAGDYILKILCSLIYGLLSEKMIFARVGGEEFAILMPLIKLQEAKNLAEKIRVAIESHRFVYDNEHIPVTLSFGVAELSNDINDVEEFISKTDSLLYLSKNTGRNKVSF